MLRRLLTICSTIALISLALIGCANTTTTESGAGSINGYVQDQDGIPLPGVTVTYSIPDAAVSKGTSTKPTDASGFFEISDLVPGTYRLTFTLASYPVGTATVEVVSPYLSLVTESSSDGSLTGGDHTNQVMMTLYKQIATASGSISLNTGSGYIPASGKTVVAMFQGKYFSSVQTDASGAYSFTGLPAGPVSFYAQNFYTGTVYYPNLLLTYTPSTEVDPETAATADLSDRSEAVAPRIWTPSMGTAPFVVSSNLSDTFAVANSITLTFNKAIASGTFTLYRSGPVNLLKNDSWSTDKLTVTIDPAETLLVGQTYFIDYVVRSADSYTASTGVSDLTFSTIPGIDLVSSNVLDIDGTTTKTFSTIGTITLTFNMSIAAYDPLDITLKDAGANTLSTVITTSGATMSIDPVNNLAAGASYTVVWTVYSSLNSGTNSDTGTYAFETAEAAITAPANVTGFALYDPTSTWKADWNTTQIPFVWNRVTGATGYNLYAGDTVNGVTQILVATVLDPGTEDYSTTILGTADLNDAGTVTSNVFDAWVGSTTFAGLQPFARGNSITFTVLAYKTNIAGTTTVYSAASPTGVSITDTTAPTATTGTGLTYENAAWAAATAAAFPYSPGVATTLTKIWTFAEAITATAADITVNGTFTTATPANRPAISKTFNSDRITVTITMDMTDIIEAADTVVISFKDTSGNSNSIAAYSF